MSFSLKHCFFSTSTLPCFSEVKTSRDTTVNRGRGRGRGERGKSDRGARGGGRGGGKNSFVQTSGLFSEGTGETHLRKSSASKEWLQFRFADFLNFLIVFPSIRSL